MDGCKQVSTEKCDLREGDLVKTALAVKVVVVVEVDAEEAVVVVHHKMKMYFQIMLPLKLRKSFPITLIQSYKF